jgi:hypothetical protein
MSTEHADLAPKCAQNGCDEKATSYVIWVDGKHVLGCADHSAKLQGLAAFLGHSVALYPIIEEAHDE